MHKYLKKIPLYIVYSILFGLFISNPVFADTVDYNVNVAPSLKLTIPDSSLVLNLNPPSKTFDSKDLTVTVGTNNATGYKLTLSTPNDNTDLERDTSSDTTAISATIPTLDTGTYTESTFTANKWGYSINSNTAIPSTVTSGFIPFTSGNTLMERDTAVNHDETELSFASKIDYLQPAGAYNTTLQFNIVANPLINYMQDLNPALCTTTPMTVVDKRDNKEYTIARLADGQCWMTQNLRFIGKTGDPAGTMTLDSSTSNVESVYTTSSPLVISYMDLTSGNSTTTAMLHTGMDSNGDPTAWYNYPATTAMQIASNVSTEATRSLCPAGWRLPTFSEQSIVINYPSEYNPVMGGHFSSGSIIQPNYGYWWASTAVNNTTTYTIQYYNNVLSLYNGGLRHSGVYVRCILNDPRTISDITTMQEINSQIIANTAEGATATLKDVRDNNTYTVAKINGSVWMTQNLRYIGDTGSSSGSMVMKSTTSNISADTTITYSDIDGAADSYTNAMIHDSGNATNGVWYNYIAATATTITGASNNNAQVYDVCPASWRLPSSSEQSSVISYKTLFNPVPGGAYNNGTFNRPDNGYWFSSTSHTTYGSGRYVLSYGNDSLSLTYCTPYYVCGCNIRCIAK